MDEPDIFAPRPPVRSKEFWDALVALGGTPEAAAPHMPDMSEAEVAEQMAQARGRAGDAPAADIDCPSYDGVRSNWCHRIHR